LNLPNAGDFQVGSCSHAYNCHRLDLREFRTFKTYSLSELVASVLLLVPRARIFSAALGIAVMTGGIFLHFFSPPGIEVMGHDGLSLDLACGVWVSGWIILALSTGEARMCRMTVFRHRDDPTSWCSSILRTAPR
jgi:hypothetical protein